MSVFIDTGGWIAIAVKKDRHHEVAGDYYTQLLHRNEKLFTSDYVLDETVTRIRYDSDHSKAVAFLDLIHQAEDRNKIKVLKVDETVWNEAERIFRQYEDQVFSFTDCTSFVLAQIIEADEIFGFDKHFSMFGFNVRPYFKK